MREMFLSQIKNDNDAVIKKILGGTGAAQRLASLGIRPGKKITKKESHFWRGPVTVMVDRTRIAIGRSMAEKIVVEVEQ